MAFRSRARIVLDAAKSDSVISGEGGLRGLMQRVRQRFGSGKFLRPDLEDDVLRKPVVETGFRYPSPGAQETPAVPQGPYKNVFDITYHSRDARRLTKREQVDVEATKLKEAQLPPTPGNPATTTFLGMLGDFDRQK